ncbi:MAG: serine/threonine protein kinase [Acidobacteriota bacterium]
MECPSCHGDVLDIDVKCSHCGTPLGATGAHRMLGQIVLGTYELVDVLGQGGMSVVFKARHKLTEQEVALKILPPELAAHSQVKSRFLEEAKALAALDHPNIVHLYNFGQENGSFVLAMQFVQGRTWERLIMESKRLDWKASCRITVDVLKALEYAHGRGVVHRDMKPSNVLVREHDASATVMDFGIAKMAQSTRLTATGQTMGTVRYMSPEQVRGQEVDLRTDIYSLGATLYESLVGDTPFDGTTHFEIMTKHLSQPPRPPSALGIEVPAVVEDVVMRCLAKRAEDRYESARDMRKLLETALEVPIVETAKLNREILGDVRSEQRSVGAALTPRAASAAAELADQLEPGTSAPRVVKAGGAPRWAWLALAIAVLAAGGVGVAIYMGKSPGGYDARLAIKTVTFTSGKKVGSLLVETDGKVTPDEVHAAYQKALDELAGPAKKLGASLDVLDEIAAIPPAALCEPTAYPGLGGGHPDNCASALDETTFGKNAARILLIVDDRASLALAMRSGVGHALCDFQPKSVQPAQLLKICDLGNQLGSGSDKPGHVDKPAKGHE